MEMTDYEGPWGKILLLADKDAITGLWLKEQKCFLQSKDMIHSETPMLTTAKAWLDDYFVGRKPDIHRLKLRLEGSNFQQSVWQKLCEIPYGETTTYGAIAKAIAAEKGIARMSAQAVGGAVGRNPIGIIVPCHRVIGADGSLTGYAGGLEVKKWLLRHEGFLKE